MHHRRPHLQSPVTEHQDARNQPHVRWKRGKGGRLMEMRPAPGRSADGASQHTKPPVDLKSATGRDRTERRTSQRSAVHGRWWGSCTGSQAAASFVLQILALRLLGADGLGRSATWYAIIVLATAVSSGFVGDADGPGPFGSADQGRASALVAGLAVGSGSRAWAGPWLSGLLTPTAAIAFGW